MSEQTTRQPVVIRKLSQLDGLSDLERHRLEPVTKEFTFRVSPYYANLIDWADPDDPLRKIVLPDESELNSELTLDASNEVNNTKAKGLQHKYRNTALLLVNDFCAAYCRFCFRKRFTLSADGEGQIVADGAEKETSFDVTEGIAYIREHTEIDNVLLTGGDPLMLAPSRLRRVIEAVRDIPHVKIIRIGTKVPTFDPVRITDEMIDVLASASTPGKRVYLMLHYNHPRELTEESLEAVRRCQRAGLSTYNQTPMLAGINDDVDTLVTLFKGLAQNGITPYYLFHCRPTMGNDSFMMTVQRGEAIVAATRPQLSGLARSFRYVASHDAGKIEIVGRTQESMVFRYHQPRECANDGRLMMWPVDKPIYWLDDVVASNEVGIGNA